MTQSVQSSVHFLLIDGDVVVEDDEQEERDTQNIGKDRQLNVRYHLHDVYSAFQSLDQMAMSCFETRVLRSG